MRSDASGFVIDVSRDSRGGFQYEVLEALKNGILLSGKYRGISITMDPPKVMVLSTHEPSYDLLSKDRWDVMILHKENMNPIARPSHQFPLVPPPPFPELEDRMPSAREIIVRDLEGAP